MAITFVQVTSVLANQFNNGSWDAPGNITLTGVGENNIVFAVGGWWDETNNTNGLTPLPHSSLGTVVPGMRQRNPNNDSTPGWPVSCQIGVIPGCRTGTYKLTPFNIGTGGDGSFVAMEFSCGGPGFIWRQVDQGSTFAGSATPGAVNGVTVTTDETNARVGDLVIAGCTSDGNPTAIGIGGPTGYTQRSSGSTSGTVLPIGSGSKLVTVDGAQSATWTVVDNDCQILSASIVVWRATAIDNGARYVRPNSELYLSDDDSNFPAEMTLLNWY